ncbi:YbaY family lipoprotein [Hymenobacter gelipurpurascens]|uniref:YbaY family lipoprotein n=1 Tax=Hymenobacter gelipurpurascens TaxID=89968 RepID=UPI001BAFB696|nr:YbaY family lipoprotein [Hymenobacter gelipurpurascens]
MAASLVSCTATPSSPGTAGTAATSAVAIVKNSVTGTLAYRGRIALPATAVVRVQLLDVSRQGM